MRVSRVCRVSCSTWDARVPCASGDSSATHGTGESLGEDGRRGLAAPPAAARGRRRHGGLVRRSGRREPSWRGACRRLCGRLASETGFGGFRTRFTPSRRQRPADAFRGLPEIRGPERDPEACALPSERHARGRKWRSGVPVPEWGSGALSGRAAFRALGSVSAPDSGLPARRPIGRGDTARRAGSGEGARRLPERSTRPPLGRERGSVRGAPSARPPGWRR